MRHSKGDGTCWLVHPTDDGHFHFDENVNYEDYGFTVENGTLVVPTVSPDGEKVVRLGTGVFCGCPSIVNIIVPDGIHVTDYNFGCPNVKNIYISAGTDMSGSCAMCGDAHDQKVVATIYTGYDSVTNWDEWWNREAHLTVECGVTLEQFYSIIGQ